MSDSMDSLKHRIELTFSNGSMYTIDDIVDNPDKFIVSMNTSEDESLNSGNPIGVMTSSSISVSILDKSGNLSISKKNGPYYGLIRNGIKLELFLKYNENTKWESYGTYYTTDWSTPYKGGTNEPTSITAKDKLNYISNKEIPKLPTYSGISIHELLDLVFAKIGIGPNEYYIDPSLDINMLFGITVGTKLRDFLNQVCQALIAKVILDRNGVIRIVPALRSYGDTYTLTDKDIVSISSRHNSSIIYNKVRVYYSRVGSTELDQIAVINGYLAKMGRNEIDNIIFNKKVLSVDQVYIVSDSVNNRGEVISDIEWSAYQNGMDLKFLSSIFNDSYVDIYVEGRVLNTSTAYEEADIEGADDYISNILDIQNELIQEADKAKQLANSLSRYMKKINNMLELDTQLIPKASIGDRLIIQSNDKDYTGTYKIISCRTSYGAVTYNKNITIIEEDT